MKAQHAVGLDLSWTRVTTVFLIDVAVLILAGRWPGDLRTATYVWWAGVGVAVLVAVTALLTYRRVPLTSALAARVLDRFADPEATLTEGRTRAVDHRRRYGHELVGMREYRGRLVTLIAVGGQPQAGRHHLGAASDVGLPVALVAAGLRQFDVRLDGIDIVSVGTPAAGADGQAGGDSNTGQSHSTPDRRGTWLVLRMDPQRNVNAVAARDSLASTFAAATERLAHDLDGRHITARVVTAEEFAGVDTAVLAGLQPERVRLRRRRLKQKVPKGPKGFVSSFWMSPQDITSENLQRLWVSETDTTAVTVRLTPRHGRTEVSVVVRYHSGGWLPRGARAGLNRLTGRQLTAVRTSLPTPMRRGLVVPARELRDQEQLLVALNPIDEAAMVRVGA